MRWDHDAGVIQFPVNLRIRPFVPCALLIPLLLSACAAGKQMVGKVREFSLADIRPAKIDVVEVREKDLRQLPTGEERLLAHQRSGRFFGFFGRADFVEPDLPEQGAQLNGSLLPSLD